MGIERLDHVNVVTTRLDEMVTWYQTVLGLTLGPRPNFPFPGAWLYAGDHPVVHLVESDQKKVGSETGLCLLYTSPSPRDLSTPRMPSSA